MRLVKTSSIEEGAVLGRTIYNEKGQILLNEGVKLNNKLIELLMFKGIHHIHIQDDKTEDIKFHETISPKLRLEAIATIESTFKQIQDEAFLSNSFVIEKAAKRYTELIRNLLIELKKDHELLALMSEVYVYDNYIFTHSLNVTMYSLAIGMQLKLSQKELETLGLGAILHDVGKMKIPEHILLKPGRLTMDEYIEVKKHAEEGFHLLRNVQTLPLLVAHCAFQHHERLNGTGYPRGIMGDDIHEFGKIIAVADVFDAVTSNRVYRQAMLPHEGLEILYAGSNTLFEPRVIEAFRQSVAIYPIGLTVELSDGRKGVVASQNIGLSERPTVRILQENGVDVSPYDLDLKSELSIVISNCDTTFKNE